MFICDESCVSSPAIQLKYLTQLQIGNKLILILFYKNY